MQTKYPRAWYAPSLKHILNWCNEMAMIFVCDTSWYGVREGQAMISDCDTHRFGLGDDALTS